MFFQDPFCVRFVFSVRAVVDERLGEAASKIEEFEDRNKILRAEILEFKQQNELLLTRIPRVAG